MENIKKIKNFICLHPEIFTIIGLCIAFYFIFIHNIWAYPLMDVDETRYVSMSKDMFNTKDFMTLYLNGEYFFEKPPLYFWGECLSFALLGQITEFSARLPVALYGIFTCFLVYFVSRKIVSRSYGVISSLILATSLEFLILAKFAILDIVVAFCIAFSVYFGMMVFFCKENHKKYFWWLFYIFSGLAVLAKGIPGFVIPFGSIFFIALVSKKMKEIFKPTYFFVGTILFLLIVLPWHIIMFKMHNPLFWDEYIIKHHVSRFLGNGTINRTQPFYFYFLTLLWGFFPYVVSVLTVWINKLVKLIKEKSFKLDYEKLDNTQRFILYNAITFVFGLLFFSSSETKLITYILPLYPFLACLGGLVWVNYIKNKEYEKQINIGVYVIGTIFLIASVATIFTPLFLPKQLYLDILDAKIITMIIFFSAGLASMLFAKKRLYTGVFATYVIFMLVLSGFCTDKFFKVDYKFGQDDLMQYAQFAKENNCTISTYDFTHKYSLIYYGDKHVNYNIQAEDFDKEINKPNNLVIIKHKQMPDIEGKKYVIIKDGRRYALLKKDNK